MTTISTATRLSAREETTLTSQSFDRRLSIPPHCLTSLDLHLSLVAEVNVLPLDDRGLLVICLVEKVVIRPPNYRKMIHLWSLNRHFFQVDFTWRARFYDSFEKSHALRSPKVRSVYNPTRRRQGGLFLDRCLQ